MTCSLFLHHLDEADAASFLRKAADATDRILLINDLVRGPVGFCPGVGGVSPVDALAGRAARRAGLGRCRIQPCRSTQAGATSRPR